MVTNLLLVIHLILAVTIIVLVLLQQGKGSDMGSAFGSNNLMPHLPKYGNEYVWDPGNVAKSILATSQKFSRQEVGIALVPNSKFAGQPSTRPCTK